MWKPDRHWTCGEGDTFEPWLRVSSAEKNLLGAGTNQEETPQKHNFVS